MASLLPAALLALRATHPDIRIILPVIWSEAIRNGAADRVYDIGIDADKVERAGVDSQIFASYPGVIAVPPDHPLVRHDEITSSPLKDCPMVGLAPEDRARESFDAVMAEAGVTPHYVIETPGAPTVCALVLSGEAVGLVIPFVVEPFRHEGLIPCPFTPKVPFRADMLFQPDDGKSRLVKQFGAERMRLRSCGGSRG